MKRLAALLIAVSMTTGCIAGYVAPVMPPTGLLFASIEAPIDTNADDTRNFDRVGSASSYSLIFGMIAFGDASMTSAARDGNLQAVNHMDYHYLNILLLFQSFTTKAYGE